MSVGDVTGILNGAIGAFGVLVIIFALLLLGHLVPKSRYDEIREERDEWKRKSEVDQAISQALIEVAGVTKETLASLRKELGK